MQWNQIHRGSRQDNINANELQNYYNKAVKSIAHRVPKALAGQISLDDAELIIEEFDGNKDGLLLMREFSKIFKPASRSAPQYNWIGFSTKTMFSAPSGHYRSGSYSSAPPTLQVSKELDLLRTFELPEGEDISAEYLTCYAIDRELQFLRRRREVLK